MKKLGIFLVALFAVGLFAVSALALTDTFSFTVTIPALNYFLITDGADSINVAAADLTAGYKNVTDSGTTIAIYDNGTWTATVALNADPSGYLLWCDDDDVGQTTTNWTALTFAGGNALSSFTGYGAAGQHDYTTINLLITGLDWSDKDATGTTYTATVTYTPST